MEVNMNDSVKDLQEKIVEYIFKDVKWEETCK